MFLSGYCLLGNSDSPMWILPFGKFGYSYVGTAFWEIRAALPPYVKIESPELATDAQTQERRYSSLGYFSVYVALCFHLSL